MKKNWLVLGFFSFLCAQQISQVDIIVFSYNRGMQLFSLLESIERHFVGFSNVYVIYRSDSGLHDSVYESVKGAFKKMSIYWKKQDSFSKKDFKSLLIQAIEATPSPYVVFAVDDIIVKNYVNLANCVDLLEQNNAYGFYLRLGKNIVASYGVRKNVMLPSDLKRVSKDVCSWTFRNGGGDWGYPNTVDMTLFRKKDVLTFVKKLNFAAPNTFEGAWNRCADLSKIGLCYEVSRVVNIPANRVQNESPNVCMGAFSPGDLSLKFKRNMKIDISKVSKLKNRSPHCDFTYTFITR